MTNSKKDFFNPENKNGEKVYLSPSGKYKLVIEYFSTGKGTWNYTQGTVYHGSNVVGVIQRNYAAFPFSWIESHPNGHDYLIGGEDYQGQTVLELDTGNRRELLPEEAKEGHGFCWSSYKYLPEYKLLHVCGCYWACPYEDRFYDFSDPMNGWPQLHVVNEEYDFIDCSMKSPTIKDGIVTTYEVVEEYDFAERYPDLDKANFTWENAKGEIVNPPENGEELEIDIYTTVSTKTYKIEGLNLVFLGEDVSPMEADYRERQRIAGEKYKAWEKEFKETDPLYLAFADGCKDFDKVPPHTWYGYTHDNWCPDHTFQENRWGKDVYDNNSCRITIEWGIKTGPVKLIVIKDKIKDEKFWMDHSVESMKSAFEYAKEIVRGLS